MKIRLTYIVWLILGLIAGVAATLRMIGCIITGSEHGKEIGLGFDCLGNTALNGSHKEYITTRAYRASQEGRAWGCIICKLLDRFDKNHCQKSGVR